MLQNEFRTGEGEEKNMQFGSTYYVVEKYGLETFFVVVKLNSSWIN